MQAIILAAGMGKRLGKYTRNQTKCMVEVAGKTLLQRAAEALRQAGITDCILVVGYEAERLVKYAATEIEGIRFEFVYNRDYDKTNNIYSMYLAREQLVRDDTILLESDLIFEPKLLQEILRMPEPNIVAVASYEQWMDGTVALLDENGNVRDFIDKQHFRYDEAGSYYKTVNIYKFSRDFLARQYLPFLEAYIRAYGVDQYYESILKTIAHIDKARLKAYVLPQGMRWYEIDDAQDLDIANTLFARKEDRLAAYECRYGGYWRFSGLKDFCYLVNPYFPPEKMVDQLTYFFKPLLTQYPSGMSIQKLSAGKMFQVEDEYLLVGNGAAELISVLGRAMTGRTLTLMPTFNEYDRCFENCDLVPLFAKTCDFAPTAGQIVAALADCDNLILINPDNPSGHFFEADELEQILDYCQANGKRCIIDESFADFAERDVRYTLLSNEILQKYDTLIVVKSISKSYGVPGLRLGVMASADAALMERMRRMLPIWNINSFAEYFFQIYGLYAAQYKKACDEIARQRRRMIDRLNRISFLRAYPSQANYVMCAVTDGRASGDLAEALLEDDILIKDLSEKRGFDGAPFIRIAVKDEQDNAALYYALEKLERR